MLGLLEYLDGRGGREEIFRIAADTHYEFGRLLAIVEAAELLDFVDTPKRLVILEPLGQRFVRAAPDEQKAIWRERIMKLQIYQLVNTALERSPDHHLDRSFVDETLVLRLPEENYEHQFRVFIGWARFGNLFAYDEVSEKITLQ